MKVLITGAAGFIGFHLVRKMLNQETEVIGLDNINDYYDPELKLARLRECGIDTTHIPEGKLLKSNRYFDYRFVRMDLTDRNEVTRLFTEQKFDAVCNLAAQAGVRYSLTNPHAYIESNIVGFLNILEACRSNTISHLVYASSSSVYGLNSDFPFSTAHPTEHPINLYAASKKSNELMAHAYSYLYGIPTTGLRFFTVYGPWGRPDMALFIFTKAILEGSTVDLFNQGQMERDFTYVDDIVEGLSRIIPCPPAGNPGWTSEAHDPSRSSAPYRIYNIGNNQSVKLIDFIEAIEETTGKIAVRNLLPMQPGDVIKTWADVDDLKRDFGYAPATPVRTGIREFVSWYRSYYNI